MLLNVVHLKILEVYGININQNQVIMDLNTCFLTVHLKIVFWDRCKANINGYEFNNVSSYNLSRTIIVTSMDQNKSITSYDYYEPNISKEKSFLENKGLSITKSTNADNRINSKSFDAKPNPTLEWKEFCSRT